MESLRTTLDTEESSRRTVQPSDAVLRPVNAVRVEKKGPEYGQQIVDRVEEALKSNDFWTTSKWLQVFNEEFSKNDQWPPDLLERMWKCVNNVLRGSTQRETRRLACQIIDALAQNNESCERNDTTEFGIEALQELIQILKNCDDDLEIRSLILKTLLSFLRGSNSQLHPNPRLQFLVQRSGVIPALLESLHVLIQLTRTTLCDPNVQKSARMAIEDSMEALYCLSCTNKDNLAILVSNGGFQIIKICLEDPQNEWRLQEHSCLLISALAVSSALSQEQIKDSITAINKTAKIQIHEKQPVVSGAAIGCLHRLFRSLLFPLKKQKDSESVGIELLKQDSLEVVVGMIQISQLKNDSALLKHCLNLLTVICRSSSDIPLLSSQSGTPQNLNTIYDQIFRSLIETTDPAVKAVLLQTLCALVTNPDFLWKEEEEISTQLDTFLECLNPAKGVLEPSKNKIFIIQVFALNVISAVIDDLSSRGVILNCSQTRKHIQRLITTIGCIIQYIGEVGEGLYFECSSNEEGMTTTGKLASKQVILNNNEEEEEDHTFGLESCTKAEVLNSILTALELLVLSGVGDLNLITDDEGFGLLHKLAKTGLDQYLKGVIEVFGGHLELARQTVDGKTALQLAELHHHANCVSILKSASAISTKTEQNEAEEGRQNPEDAAFLQQQKQCLRNEKKKQIIHLLCKPDKDSTSKTSKPVAESPCLGLLSSKDSEHQQGALNQSKMESNNDLDLLERRRRLEALDEDTLLGIKAPRKPESIFQSPLLHSSQVSLHRDQGQLPKSASTEGSITEIPDGLQFQPLGSSLSVGSRYNNYISDTSGVSSGDWSNLEESQFKLSMVSSSSGQNNQFPVEQALESTEQLRLIWLNTVQVKNTGLALDEAQEDGELPDDNQILSWMSSEIFGLISSSSGLDETEDTKTTTTSKNTKEQFLNNPVLEHRQMADPLTSSSSSSLLSMDPSLSPFYSARPLNTSHYLLNTSNPLVPSAGPMGNVVPMIGQCTQTEVPSKHLWLGNLNTRLPRTVLKSIFEEYGPLEDVVTFPGRMYAFVNFIHPQDAQRAAKELDNLSLPLLTGSRRLVIKFRPNRKALGRVGDLMPGVVHVEDTNEGVIAPSISVPIFSSNEVVTEEAIGGDSVTSTLPPSRHLWLGNVCLRPSKIFLFSLFSRYGPVQSVRVFPGKTFAFINFSSKDHAIKAKEALDQKILEPVTGTKPLVVRFQREGAAQSAWTRANPENICTSLPHPPSVRGNEGSANSSYGLTTDTTTAIEATSIGYLTRSLSAAVSGRSLNPQLLGNPFNIVEKTPQDGGFGDPSSSSSVHCNPDFGLSLSSSFSGSSDGKGNFTPFSRVPCYPSSRPWTNEQTMSGLVNSTEQFNGKFDFSGLPNLTPSSHMSTTISGTHTSLPEEIFITNQIQTSVGNSGHQLVSSTEGNMQSSVLSYHGGSIW